MTDKTNDELKKLKRKGVNALAVEGGLLDAGSFTSKDVVIGAIARVQAGEDATAVNEELKPVAKASGKYQVRVTNEFRAATSANRISGGLSIPRDGIGLIEELSADQLQELENDKYVTLTPYEG